MREDLIGLAPLEVETAGAIGSENHGGPSKEQTMIVMRPSASKMRRRLIAAAGSVEIKQRMLIHHARASSPLGERLMRLPAAAVATKKICCFSMNFFSFGSTDAYCVCHFASLRPHPIGPVFRSVRSNAANIAQQLDEFLCPTVPALRPLPQWRQQRCPSHRARKCPGSSSRSQPAGAWRRWVNRFSICCVKVRKSFALSIRTVCG